MDDPPRSDAATRILALSLAIGVVVVWLPFSFDAGIHTFDLAQYSWRLHDAIESLVLLGLVLRTDRRLVPGIAFVAWLSMPTFGAVVRVAAGPDMPALLTGGPETLVFVGLLAAIVWDRARQAGWLVALLCVHFVFRILLNLLPLLGIGDPLSTWVLPNALVTLLLLAVLVLLARNARPSRRSPVAFWVAMLGWMPLVRIWMLLGTFDPVSQSLDERGLAICIRATEVALFTGAWIAFEVLRGHGHDTRGVRPAMAIAGSALVLPTAMELVFNRRYDWWEDLEYAFYASLLVAVLATVAAFVTQLRSLAAIARTAGDSSDDEGRSDRMVFRAWVTAALIALPALTGVLTVAGAQFIRPNDPMAWAIYLGAATTMGLVFLASLAWSFLAFGIARVLARSPSPGARYPPE